MCASCNCEYFICNHLLGYVSNTNLEFPVVFTEKELKLIKDVTCHLVFMNYEMDYCQHTSWRQAIGAIYLN